METETKITKIKTESLDFLYPIIDGHKFRYIRHPSTNNDGKWEAVEVNIDGGYWWLIAPVEFDTEGECQKACDIHNGYHKFTAEQIEYVLKKSFKVK